MKHLLAWLRELITGRPIICGQTIATHSGQHRCGQTNDDHGYRHVCPCGDSWPAV